MLSDFYHNNPGEKIWWADSDNCGEWIFSFDKNTLFNMFEDYPHNMTPEEVELFDKENPFWAEFFRDRKAER